METKEKKTLAQVMPREFSSSEYDNTQAYGFKNVIVIKEHCLHSQQNSYKNWIGIHKNVNLWVELENGYAVGWNENPSRGWSFPVVKINKL